MSSFQLPRIKVCGLTRSEDVALALEAGAEALGFVHHPPSPRSVDATRAQSLTSAVPSGISCIGVFVDIAPDEVRAWCEAAGIGAVQLCGAEAPADWRGFAFPIVRRVPIDDDALESIDAWKGIAAGYLLDHPSGPGGTGCEGDPERARRILEHHPAILAGGLHDGNVADAIQRLRPSGVDASSKLELEPGRKDPERLRRFVESARTAFDALGAR